MSGQSLDYSVLNKNQLELLQGKIDTICQKNTEGIQFLVNEANPKVTIEIKLRHKAVVSFFEVQNFYSDKVTFELVGEKNIVHETVIHKFKDDKQTTLVQAKQSCVRKKETLRVRVQLENELNTKAVVGLGYLLVRGNKCPDEPKNKSLNKLLSENTFNDAKASPHYKASISKVRDNKQTAIFSQRKKNKEPEMETEEQQLKKAIQLSKKEAEKKNTLKQTEKKQSKPKEMVPMDEWSITFQSKPRQYTRIDYDKCKDIFKYVNTAWVEAQKKAEIEKGIMQSQKLSNAIVVRAFHNKVICLDIAQKQKKRELQMLCIEMGAKMKESPQDHCILIADRTDTQKVAKGRKLRGVKILRSNFITECSQCKAYLDEKEYAHNY